MAQYKVIVGNVGTVNSGPSRTNAERAYKAYVEISKSGVGRAGNEPVTLMKDGEIYSEYDPTLNYAEDACDEEDYSEKNSPTDEP